MSALDLAVWDSSMPILLPVDAKTMAGVGPASIGLLIPFVFFSLSLFQFLYREKWMGSFSMLMNAQNIRGFERASSYDSLPRVLSLYGGDGVGGDGGAVVSPELFERHVPILGLGGVGGYPIYLRE